MLRIIIELVPHGDEARAKAIGVGVIVNTGTGTLELGNYHAGFEIDGNAVAFSTIEGFQRLDRNAWDLLKAALNNCELKDD